MGLLPDTLRGADALEVARVAFRAADAALPVLPDDVVGALHVMVLAGFAYAFDVPFISFKGERIRVLGKFVTTRDAILALLVAFGVLAGYRWWSVAVYDVFVLTGWQAFGVVCVETTVIILAKSHRNLDRWTVAMALAGAFLFAVPVLGS